MKATSEFTIDEKKKLHIMPTCDQCGNLIGKYIIFKKDPYYKVYLCKKCKDMVKTKELTEKDLKYIYRTKMMRQ